MNNVNPILLLWSRDSSLSMVTGYGLHSLGSIPGSAKFSLPNSVQTNAGAHPAPHPMCTGALFTGIKQQGHEACHSSPSSAEVKKSGSIPSLPHTSSLHNA
jgi:hypothetical protein